MCRAADRASPWESACIPEGVRALQARRHIYGIQLKGLTVFPLYKIHRMGCGARGDILCKSTV